MVNRACLLIYRGCRTMPSYYPQHTFRICWRLSICFKRRRATVLLVPFFGKMTYLAVAISTIDTDSALIALRQVAGQADLAEIRLDLMQSFDLPHLLAERPLPVIITCRPVREGGRWNGGEAERLAILRQAASLGAEYVDLEWDGASELGSFDRSRTRIILSRHDFTGMPADLMGQANALWAAGPDVVKVVGMAHTFMDSLPVLRVLKSATRPTVAIAMGSNGLITRLLAFRYANSFLTFAAPDGDTRSAAPSTASPVGAGTAPGQLTISVMKTVYRVPLISEHTQPVGLVQREAANSPLLAEGNQWLARTSTDAVLLPLEQVENGSLALVQEAMEEVAPFQGYLAPETDHRAIRCTRRGDDREKTFGEITEALRWLIRSKR